MCDNDPFRAITVICKMACYPQSNSNCRLPCTKNLYLVGYILILPVLCVLNTKEAFCLLFFLEHSVYAQIGRNSIPN